MSLLVALDASGIATGTLYWDDGEERNVEDNYLYLQFTCNEVANRYWFYLSRLKESPISHVVNESRLVYQ